VAKRDHQQSREDRLKIAAEIVNLSGRDNLETVERKHHIALKIGTGNYSNAVMVSDSDYVKFFIRPTDLRERAQEEGFAPEIVKSTGPYAGSGFRFKGLRLNHIQAHEGFFRAVVQESINEIIHRRGREGARGLRK
jgi:hypothetical protein